MMRYRAGSPTMSKGETASVIGVSNDTVRRLLEDGSLKAVRIGWRVLVLRESIESFLAGSTSKAFRPSTRGKKQPEEPMTATP
jgi:excisionase family DNA binding protein